MTELTRKDFYNLTAECREMALDLARHEQDRVNVETCHAFNAWLPGVLAFERLAQDLPGLAPARPLTRWRLFLVIALVGALLALLFQDAVGRNLLYILVSTMTLTGIALIFVPERLYGTTVALLEGKLLRIVDLLEEMLLSQELDFTEAAFFKAKENITQAKRELRQQLHLAARW